MPTTKEEAIDTLISGGYLPHIDVCHLLDRLKRNSYELANLVIEMRARNRFTAKEISDRLHRRKSERHINNLIRTSNLCPEIREDWKNGDPWAQTTLLFKLSALSVQEQREQWTRRREWRYYDR